MRELKELALAVDRSIHGRFASAGGELFRKDDGISRFALGQQACVPRLVLVKLGSHDAKGGARQGIVEPNHDLALLNGAAVPDQDLLDHAAGRMLDLFDDQLDDHRAASDHCPGEFAGRGPAANAADEGNHHRQPGDVQAADHGARPAFAGGARRIKVCLGTRLGGCSAGHEIASWFGCNARFPATAGRSGRTTPPLRSTASDGPNACCVPLASTRILLH